MLTGLFLQSVIIIVIWFLGHGMAIGPLHLRVDPSGRVGGTIGSPNGAGSYLALLLPLAVALLGGRVPRAFRIGAAMSCIAAVPALIMTASRGAWAAALVSLSLLLIVAVRRGHFPVKTLLICLIGFIILVGAFHGQIGRRLFGDDRGAATSRLPLMRIAARIIADHPLIGVGANNYVVASRPYTSTSEFRGVWNYAVHNKYLLVWAETGTIGLLAFALFLGEVLVCGWRAWCASDEVLALTALGLSAGIVGHSLHMMVDVLHGRPSVQMLWLVAGLLMGLNHIVKSKRRVEPRSAVRTPGPIVNRGILNRLVRVLETGVRNEIHVFRVFFTRGC